MTRYEGLNLPELLDLLHGPALSEPPAWMPQTPGWWIVLAWFLAAVAIAAVTSVRWSRRNAYRRRAEAELRVLEVRAEEDWRAAGAELGALLKRTALAAYPRQQVAALHGEAWARFLVVSCGDDAAVAAVADELARVAYRGDGDWGALVPAARRWIRLHRA